MKAGSIGWSESYKGKTIAKVKDHGNGYKIKLGGRVINLDYSEAEDLRILLKFMNEDAKLEEFETVEHKI
jgi:hypothetical protein